MSLLKRLRSVRGRINNCKDVGWAVRARRGRARLHLEALEDRTLFSVHVLSSFKGLDTNNAGGFVEPPDPIAAAGPTAIVEEVNSNIAFYAKATGHLLSEQGLDVFFAPVDSVDFLFSDVNVSYDEQAGRFFVSTMDINFDPTAPGGLASYFDFAISNDSNPLDGFTEMHQINTTEVSDRTGETLFTDFPRLGWNADAYVVAFNMFGFLTEYQYNMQLLTIQKSSVLDKNNATLTTYRVDRPLPNSTLVPAVMHGSAPGDPMWLVEEKGLEQDGNYADLRVVKMTNLLSATPTFTDYYVPMGAYTITPFPQDTMGEVSNVLDTRILNVDWRNNEMVLEQNVGIESDTNVHARWYEISTAGAAPSMVQQGTLNPGPGIDTYMPSVALAADGTIGMTYIESSATENMSMYVTGRAPSDPLGTMQGAKLVKAGEQFTEGTRIGDFSGIAVDPTDGTTFWAVNEYTITTSILAGFPNWGTWIGHFNVDSSPGVAPAPTGNGVASSRSPSTSVAPPRNDNLGRSRGKLLLQHPPVGSHRGNGGRIVANGPGGGISPLLVSKGTNFPGLNTNDAGGFVEPPDPIAAAGPTAIVEEVNSNIAYYDKVTGKQLFNEGLDVFFAPVDSIDFLLSDVNVSYDEQAGRFFVSTMDINFDPTAPGGLASYFDFAISNDSNPLDGFTEMHQINTTEVSDRTGETLFTDFPRLGWNADAYVVAFNMFGFLTEYQYNMQLLTIQKSSVLDKNNATLTYHRVDRPLPNSTLVPAVMHGSAAGDPMWLVEEKGLEQDSSYADLRVVKMINLLSATPTFTDYYVPMDAYTITPFPQDTMGTVSNVLDTRILNVDWRNNEMALAQNVGIDSDMDVHTRWYEIGTAGAAPSMAQQGTLNPGPGIDTYMPSVALAADGTIGMTYIESSATENMSMYVTGRVPSDPTGTMQSGVLVKAGELNYQGTRIGDFSGITVDPANGTTFWAVNEYAINTTNISLPNWGTWIASFNVIPLTTARGGFTVVATEGSDSGNQTVATFTDPSDPTATPGDFTATIDWGDGSTSSGTITQPGGVGTMFVVSGHHAYAEEGTFAITVSITDKAGNTASATSSASVADAALTATGGFTVTATEGSASASQTVATFTDANSTAPVSDFTATIDWGDGSTPTAGTVTQPGGIGTAFVVSGSHTYAEEGASYSIKVSITDVGSSTASATSAANVADAALTATGGFTVTATEGSASASQTVATFTDANPTAPVSDFTATIDWGDGSTPTAGTITQPGGIGSAFVVSGSHTYAEEGAFYSIKVSITDVGSSTASATSAASVADAALTATGGFTVTATEGSASASQTVATFTDANPAAPVIDFTAMIDWGDGSTSTAGVITQPNGIGTGFVVSGSHTYAEEGASYSIKVSITDMGGSTASATSTADVSDPAVLATGGFTVSGTEAVDSSSQIVATFKDPAGPETLANYSATVAWGDGSTSAGTISFDSGTQVFTVSGHHTYAEQGTPTIAVTIHHDSAADATVTSSALIRIRSDITGRWVQGGSWWTGVSTGSSFVTSSWAAWSPKVRWVDVITGDFNGDGRADIAGRDPTTGLWWVGLSTGSSFATTSWTAWSTKVTWVDVQVGDFNGDGKDDIIGRVLETGQWWMAQSTSSSFTNSLWATWSAAATWVDVKVGDFNGDGKADITGRWLEGGSWWTGLSTGSSFTTTPWATWNPRVTWVDVKVGDFNGDGKADITGRWLEGGSWWTGISTGSSFTTTAWAQWNPTATWVDVQVGDFNGDGKADITGRWLEGGSWWTAISTGSSFTTTMWAQWNPTATWVDVQVGDFNGDGKTDITGRWLEGGSWWTGLSTGTSFITTPWATWNTGAFWANVHTGDYA
jgi:hypothetical protein